MIPLKTAPAKENEFSKNMIFKDFAKNRMFFVLMLPLDPFLNIFENQHFLTFLNGNPQGRALENREIK